MNTIKQTALELADEQEQALLAVANGEMKIGKLPVEPFVRGYAMLREQHAQLLELQRHQAEPLCWVFEDELPKSMTTEAYNALFAQSKVDGVRMFPVFGPQPAPQAEPVADGEYLPLPMQYACAGPFPVYSAYQMREYADAHRKSATALQAEHMVPEGWREQFAQAVYADLAAADNQDVPLEEYPGRILKVLDSIVGPHHPTVVHWRNDAIRACIEIVKRYGAGTTAYQERDMAALYTAPQAQPADALDAETIKKAARYDWLRDDNAYAPEEEGVRGGELLDDLCDAGIAEKKGGQR